MIVDLGKFIAAERPGWEKLDRMLQARADDPWGKLSLTEARELERLYLRASADLAKLATFAAEPEVRRYLENLVARGHAEMHGGRSGRERWRPLGWMLQTLPQTFRRRAGAFWLATAVMVGGSIFGAFAIAFDAEAKAVLMPFDHLLGDPSERVAREEANSGGGDDGRSTFAGQLMTHNTRVALLSMSLGLSFGVGTVVVTFSNGVMLGAVAVDYVLAGETTFLLGWLLPHGVIELPALLVGSQAGLVMAGALLGRGRRQRLPARLREVVPDVVTLAACAGLMLVWAGLVESYLSQHHEPVIPYGLKIAFGVTELAALVWYLGWCGRERRVTNATADEGRRA